MGKITIHKNKYKKIERTLDEVKVNLIGIPIMIFIILVVNIIYRVIWGKNIFSSFNYLVLIWTILLVIVHEILHGVGWCIGGHATKENITFGFNWKGLMPYCHCNKPLPVNNYRLGVVLPTIILGFIPIILGIILNNSELTAIGTIMTIAGVGDFMILWSIRDLLEDAMILDHHTKPGCIVYFRMYI